MKNRLFSARLAVQAGAIALAAVLAGCGTPSVVDEHGKTDKETLIYSRPLPLRLVG